LKSALEDGRFIDFRKEFSEKGVWITPTNLPDMIVTAFNDYELKSP